MSNEPVGVEVLEADILQRAGIESRDDLPITIECTWGVNTDGSPRVFQVGETHPLLSDHLIFAIFQNPAELRIYSLCPQKNGGAAKSPKEEMRANPTRMTLVKTSRCTMTEVMVLDVFVESIAQDLIILELDTYGEPSPEESGKKDVPATKPQLVPPPTGS